MSNAVVYCLAYVFLLVPTYILPYFGSNSVIASAIHKGFLGSLYPLFWIHLSFSIALCLIAWLRGPYVARNWLVTLPSLAAAFDLVPGLSLVPLVPTVLNVLAIILGAMAPAANQRDLSTAGAAIALKLGIGLPSIAICLVLAALGYVNPWGKGATKQQFAVVPKQQPPSSAIPSIPTGASSRSSFSDVSPINSRWLGTWTNSSTKQQLVITEKKVDDCNWVGQETLIPRYAGCWAFYGRESQTIAQLVDPQKFKVDASSLALAKALNQQERYRVVQMKTLDDKGNALGDDGGTVYLLEGDSIFAIASSVEGSNSELVVRVSRLSKPHSTSQTSPATSIQSSNLATVISDNFDGGALDPSVWESKGNRVLVNNGYVSLQAAETDNAGQMWTKSLSNLSTVKVTVRHWMQPSGTKPFFPMLVLRDESGQPIADLRWLRSNDPPTYCGKPENYDKVLLHAGGVSCAYVSGAKSSDFFGVWVDTEINYDQVTGRYSATSIAPTASVRITYTIPLERRKKVRDVYFSGYGWFTGHEHRIDSVRVAGKT